MTIESVQAFCTFFTSYGAFIAAEESGFDPRVVELDAGGSPFVGKFIFEVTADEGTFQFEFDNGRWVDRDQFTHRVNKSRKKLMRDVVKDHVFNTIQKGEVRNKNPKGRVKNKNKNKNK